MEVGEKEEREREREGERERERERERETERGEVEVEVEVEVEAEVERSRGQTGGFEEFRHARTKQKRMIGFLSTPPSLSFLAAQRAFFLRESLQSV